MKTHFKTTRAFLSVVKKSALAISLITITASGAIAQTNTFPSSGNVGIGTTAPANPLTINQTGNSVNRILSLANDSPGSSAQSTLSFFEGATEKFKFGMNSSGATGYVGGANAFQLWHFQNAPIVFGTNSTERMRINGAGNVGIGTTSPATSFHVKSTTATVSPRFESTFGSATLDQRARLPTIPWSAWSRPTILKAARSVISTTKTAISWSRPTRGLSRLITNTMR